MACSRGEGASEPSVGSDVTLHLVMLLNIALRERPVLIAIVSVRSPLQLDSTWGTGRLTTARERISRDSGCRSRVLWPSVSSERPPVRKRRHVIAHDEPGSYFAKPSA